MWKEIFTFEIRYHLKQPLFYLVTFFFALMTFFAVSSDTVSIGGSIGNVNRNAPYVIIQFLAIMSAVGLFVVTAFVASPAQRDFERNTHELFFSKPMRKFDYLVGRFAGSLVVSFFVFVGAALGILLGGFMPWLDPERVGPFFLAPYVFALGVLVLPNLIFMGTTFFALTTWTRSLLFTYLGVVAFFVLYTISGVMLADVENDFAASLFDPFGFAALQSATKYWTIIERNTAVPEISGVLLYNRLLWMGVGLAVFAVTYLNFSYSRAASGRRARRKHRLRALQEAAGRTPQGTQATLARLAPSFGPGTTWRQFLYQTRLETLSILKSIPFIVILAFGMFNVIGGASFVDQIFGTKVLPVTHLMLQAMEGSFLFLLVIIITFYSGDLIWKERGLRLHEVYDATPTANGVFLGSKLVALFLVILTFTLAGILTVIGFQIYHGYTQLELGLYAKGSAIGIVTFSLVAILAVFIQVLTNNKFFGYLLMILYLLSQNVLQAMDFQHHLYSYASTGGLPYSDLNGYGHFVTRFAWLSVYWSFAALVLLTLAALLWVRGTDAPFKTRLRIARQRLTPALATAACVGLVGFLATGAYVFYNTNLLNEYVPNDRAEQRQARYEKDYRQYRDKDVPRIVAVDADVDIFPRQRRVEIRGRYEMVNKSSQPIAELHLNLSREVRVHRLEFRDHETKLADDELGYYIYGFKKPLDPGESMELSFELSVENRGFRNHGSNVNVVYNGTFFNNRAYFPLIGYDEGRQLVDRNTRRKHDLPPVHRMAKIDDVNARRNTYLGSDSDWVDFETTVSTSVDQIAIAPGYLQKEWTEGDRRYFHYKMDAPILHFFSYLSADYEVLRDRWNDVAIEIYYKEGHEYNLDRMVDSIKKSLDYFTTHFSPYQHRQVRIIEFPRYARFAQSFPNTIPYSEALGFITRVDDEEDIDYIFYVTAHEVAHQWWAHQVIGGNVQGATMLSETMAQYSALMVMEKEYGREKMRRFLKYELDNYLRSRGGELVEEMPLKLVENQPYIHYRKGSVVMYALRDYVGEEALNRALSRYVQDVAFQEPPFTTTLEFLDYVMDVVPEEMTPVVADMFSKITLFENEVDKATYRQQEDGTYVVTIEARAKKLRADGFGLETEIPMDDWVDVGVFGEEKKNGKSEETVLYLERRHIQDPELTFEVVVPELPVRAGIDPYNKLVDRNSEDNVKKVSESS